MAGWARDPDDFGERDHAVYGSDSDFARDDEPDGGLRGFARDDVAGDCDERDFTGDDGGEDDRDLPLESDMDDDDDPEVVACPNCREPVSEIAEKCPHCGDWIVPGGAEASGGRGWAYAIAAVVMAVAILVLATRGC